MKTWTTEDVEREAREAEQLDVVGGRPAPPAVARACR